MALPKKNQNSKSKQDVRKEKRKRQRKMLKGKRKPMEPLAKRRKIEETSDEDEDEDIHNIIAEAKKSSGGDEDDMYEEAEETTQETKLRLAKEYLAEIKANKEENEETADDFVAQKLKEDMLESAGQLRKPFACVVEDLDSLDVRYMRCRWQDKSLTCVVASQNHIFTASKNGTIVKWTLEKREGVIKNNFKNSSKPGHKAYILGLAVSSDGKFLASGDTDGKINIWKVADLSHLKAFHSHQKAITGLSFQRGSHTLFSCSEDRLLMEWNIDILALVEQCGGHEDGITSVDCHNKESCISSGGRDQNIVINIFQEDKQLMFTSKHSSVDGVKLLNERTFITFGQEGSICLWIMGKKWAIHTMPEAHGTDIFGTPHWITSVATLINTDLFASGSMDGHIKLWKVNANKKMELIRTIKVAGFINYLEFTPSGSHLLAAVGQEHKLGRWSKIEVKSALAIIKLTDNEMEE